MYRLLLVVGFLLITAFLVEYRLVGQAVYGDGRYYWALTRSLYFSHNIDLSDEMGHRFSPRDNNEAKPIFVPNADFAGTTKTITNSFSLGISLIWLPFYALADSIVVVLSFLGVQVMRNGFNDIYQLVVGIGNILFVLAGVGVLYQLLLRMWKTTIVVPTLISIVMATNLLYYGSLDVLNSHPAGFLLVCILLWLFMRDRKKPEMRLLFYQGLVVGLLMANRSQDILFGVLPVVAVMVFHGRIVRERLKLLLLTLGGVVLTYIPQLLLLYFGQQQVVLLPHTDQSFHIPQHFLGILFDPKLGVAFYMPLFLIGIVGLYLLRKRDTVLSYTFLTVIMLHYLAIASWSGWHQASYTMRYFVSLLPLVAFGIAEIYALVRKRFSQRIVYILVIVAVLHQMYMIMQFKLFLQDPTTVGTELSQSGKLKMEIQQKLDALLP